MTLGELINKYIAEHNLSMRKFSQLVGVSHSYISYIINGAKPNGEPLVPTIAKYRAIARAMGMDVNDLIAMVDDDIAWGTTKEQEDEDIFSTEEIRLVHLYRIADDRDKEVINTILKRYEGNIPLSGVS